MTLNELNGAGIAALTATEWLDMKAGAPMWTWTEDVALEYGGRLVDKHTMLWHWKCQEEFYYTEDEAIEAAREWLESRGEDEGNFIISKYDTDANGEEILISHRDMSIRARG